MKPGDGVEKILNTQMMNNLLGEGEVSLCFTLALVNHVLDQDHLVGIGIMIPVEEDSAGECQGIFYLLTDPEPDQRLTRIDRDPEASDNIPVFPHQLLCRQGEGNNPHNKYNPHGNSCPLHPGSN